MSIVQHEFLRRYATSPIHVPRLERLLAVYAPPETPDQFARTYIAVGPCLRRSGSRPDRGRTARHVGR